MPSKHPTPSLSLLLGTRILDARGQRVGRLHDIAVGTGADAGRVAGIVIRNRAGLCWVSAVALDEQPDSTLRLEAGAKLEPLRGDESFVLLRQDLLDRQIIDVHGRKVVRVNDVDLQWFPNSTGTHGAQQDSESAARTDLRVREVEIGTRGAARRLLVGLVPMAVIEWITCRIAARVIPWDFVDLIEADPARRVKLKLSHERLAALHPSDIAEILDDLGPAEREAIFATLDEGVAAHALEEAEPSLQKALVESMDSERVASIVDEMDPEAAADMLAELPAERSSSILEEMDEDQRQDVEELLEFRENSAAGRMTTDYVQVGFHGTVADAIEALRHFEGAPETVTEVYLVEDGPGARSRQLRGTVPLARLLLAQPDTRLAILAERRFPCVQAEAHEQEVAELFDKYNLRALPVVNTHGALVGVVEADHVIAFLRDSK
jgi:sporulation protein YlmC with PRC-barrel domain/CBS domain-containing protein